MGIAYTKYKTWDWAYNSWKKNMTSSKQELSDFSAITKSFANESSSLSNYTEQEIIFWINTTRAPVLATQKLCKDPCDFPETQNLRVVRSESSVNTAEYILSNQKRGIKRKLEAGFSNVFQCPLISEAKFLNRENASKKVLEASIESPDNSLKEEVEVIQDENGKEVGTISSIFAKKTQIINDIFNMSSSKHCTSNTSECLSPEAKSQQILMSHEDATVVKPKFPSQSWPSIKRNCTSSSSPNTPTTINNQSKNKLNVMKKSLKFNFETESSDSDGMSKAKKACYRSRQEENRRSINDTETADVRHILHQTVISSIVTKPCNVSKNSCSQDPSPSKSFEKNGRVNINRVFRSVIDDDKIIESSPKKCCFQNFEGTSSSALRNLSVYSNNTETVNGNSKKPRDTHFTGNPAEHLSPQAESTQTSMSVGKLSKSDRDAASVKQKFPSQNRTLIKRGSTSSSSSNLPTTINDKFTDKLNGLKKNLKRKLETESSDSDGITRAKKARFRKRKEPKIESPQDENTNTIKDTKISDDKNIHLSQPVNSSNCTTFCSLSSPCNAFQDTYSPSRTRIFRSFFDDDIKIVDSSPIKCDFKKFKDTSSSFSKTSSPNSESTEKVNGIFKKSPYQHSTRNTSEYFSLETKSKQLSKSICKLSKSDIDVAIVKQSFPSQNQISIRCGSTSSSPSNSPTTIHNEPKNKFNSVKKSLKRNLETESSDSDRITKAKKSRYRKDPKIETPQEEDRNLITGTKKSNKKNNIQLNQTVNFSTDTKSCKISKNSCSQIVKDASPNKSFEKNSRLNKTRVFRSVIDDDDIKIIQSSHVKPSFQKFKGTSSSTSSNSSSDNIYNRYLLSIKSLQSIEPQSMSSLVNTSTISSSPKRRKLYNKSPDTIKEWSSSKLDLFEFPNVF